MQWIVSQIACGLENLFMAKASDEEECLEGNTAFRCVRLSNLIFRNAVLWCRAGQGGLFHFQEKSDISRIAPHDMIFPHVQIRCTFEFKAQVTFLLLMKFWRPRVWVMVEQPLSSWMFKKKPFLELVWRWGLKKHLTYLGPYGHDLLKGCHLMSNLKSLDEVEIRATKEVRQKHARRVAEKNQRLQSAGKHVKKYWVKLPGGRFQGAADLPSSAVYPDRFVKKVYRCWRKTRQ